MASLLDVELIEDAAIRDPGFGPAGLACPVPHASVSQHPPKVDGSDPESSARLTPAGRCRHPTASLLFHFECSVERIRRSLCLAFPVSKERISIFLLGGAIDGGVGSHSIPIWLHSSPATRRLSIDPKPENGKS
jgi:hypothetical protein